MIIINKDAVISIITLYKRFSDFKVRVKYFNNDIKEYGYNDIIIPGMFEEKEKNIIKEEQKTFQDRVRESVFIENEIKKGDIFSFIGKSKKYKCIKTDETHVYYYFNGVTKALKNKVSKIF